jgi:hypothetical protein
LRDAYRKQLAQLGVFVEGTLCKVQRPGRKPPVWQLTFKEAGKTRTVYVPRALVVEVKQWARTYKQLKQVVHKVSMQSLAIIQRHGAVQRAASRARRPSTRRTGGTSTRSSATASRT